MTIIPNKPVKRKTPEEVTEDLKKDLKHYRREYYRLNKLISQQERGRGTQIWVHRRNKQFNELRAKRTKILKGLNNTKSKLRSRGITL